MSARRRPTFAIGLALGIALTSVTPREGFAASAPRPTSGATLGLAGTATGGTTGTTTTQIDKTAPLRGEATRALSKIDALATKVRRALALNASLGLHVGEDFLREAQTKLTRARETAVAALNVANGSPPPTAARISLFLLKVKTILSELEAVRPRVEAKLDKIKQAEGIVRTQTQADHLLVRARTATPPGGQALVQTLLAQGQEALLASKSALGSERLPDARRLADRALSLAQRVMDDARLDQRVAATESSVASQLAQVRATAGSIPSPDVQKLIDTAAADLDRARSAQQSGQDSLATTSLEQARQALSSAQTMLAQQGVTASASAAPGSGPAGTAGGPTQAGTTSTSPQDQIGLARRALDQARTVVTPTRSPLGDHVLQAAQSYMRQAQEKLEAGDTDGAASDAALAQRLAARAETIAAGH